MLACRGAAARLDSFTSTLDVMIWSPKINSWTLKMMVWFRFLPFFLVQTRCILRWTQPRASSRMKPGRWGSRWWQVALPFSTYRRCKRWSLSSGEGSPPRVPWDAFQKRRFVFWLGTRWSCKKNSRTWTPHNKPFRTHVYIYKTKLAEKKISNNPTIHE